MSSFICHFQLFARAVVSLMLSQSPEMASDRWMRDWTFESSSLVLYLVLVTVAAVAPAAEAGVSTSCAAPLLPVPLSLQYGSSVWEAAIPLFLPPHHLSVLLWVLAPQCPPHPIEETGTKSLWYLAPRCPEQVMLTACCPVYLWTIPDDTLCCRSPPSCYSSCCRSTCLCCTQTKSSKPASSVCLCLSPATFVLFCAKPALA